MAIKWPKMMKIDILLVGHPITQPTGQDWFISFCKIKKNFDPPPLKHIVPDDIWNSNSKIQKREVVGDIPVTRVSDVVKWGRLYLIL